MCGGSSGYENNEVQLNAEKRFQYSRGKKSPPFGIEQAAGNRVILLNRQALSRNALRYPQLRESPPTSHRTHQRVPVETRARRS